MSEKLTKNEQIEVYCQDIKRLCSNGLDALDNFKVVSASRHFNEISKIAEMIFLKTKGEKEY